MKVKVNKFVSLFLALVMVISLATVGATVFAEEPPEMETRAAEETQPKEEAPEVTEAVPVEEEVTEKPADAEEPFETEKPETSDEPIVVVEPQEVPEASEVEEIASPEESTDNDIVTGAWGEYATYSWDPAFKVLTITQVSGDVGGVIDGDSVQDYKNLAEVVNIIADNEGNGYGSVKNFHDYSMETLCVYGYVYGEESGAEVFKDCPNLKKIIAKGTFSGFCIAGCDNLEQFVIAGPIMLDFYCGIPKTCVIYGPNVDDYVITAQYQGYTYVVIDSYNPCDYGQHSWIYGPNDKAPTCTEDGYSEIICQLCNAQYETNGVREALGHVYNEETHRCDRCGELDPNFGGNEDPVDPENPFKDVKPGKWYYDAVMWAVATEVTAGTSATTFSPDKECTRAEIVTFLWRAAGSPEPTITECNFKDVKPGRFYYTPVLWAVENHVTAGTSETTFSPDETCTRAQIVTFIWRQKGSVVEGDASKFDDLKPNAYYIPAVAWAVYNNVTAGTSSHEFSPDKTCNRAEAVTFIYRAYSEG